MDCKISYEDIKIKNKISRNYRAGLQAEEIVAQKYQDCGFEIIGRRVRRREGELDIIAAHKDKFYFIEVKKSTDFYSAGIRITPQKIERLKCAALRFLADHKHPLDTYMRFDAALVDKFWRVKVITNAFA